jgi:hypothetical protein
LLKLKDGSEAFRRSRTWSAKQLAFERDLRIESRQVPFCRAESNTD